MTERDEALFHAVNIMLEAVVCGYAERFPSDDYRDVRLNLETTLSPLFSAYGQELVKRNFDQWEARVEISRAASGEANR